jgi:hypothetical protein
MTSEAAATEFALTFADRCPPAETYKPNRRKQR